MSRGPNVAARIAQVDQDLADLDQQVAEGEIAEATADRLRARYLAEREELLTTDEDDAEPAAAPIAGARLLGVGAALVAVIAVGLWLVASNSDDQSAVEGVAAEGVDLADVSNEEMEAVIAQNPGIPGMRLALADRYFAEGEFGDALTHYMYVLDTLELKDPAALANVGWMTYLSGVPDVAASFVEESLEIQPDGGIAFWYLANIRFYGLGDPEGAVRPLQQLLAYENLPDTLRSEAELLLVEAEAAE